MPSFKAAAIEVLAGDVDTAVVRWVHSSEVYEMGGLLSGGEVLLTTGLGLHGRSPEQLTAYIDQLADAGCVALAMEVGRSFLTAPPELVEASRRRGLAFLALHAVVPFERMVEDFHDLMLRRTLGSAQAGEPVWQELLSLVVAGQGMTALLDKVSRLAGAASICSTRMAEPSSAAQPAQSDPRPNALSTTYAARRTHSVDLSCAGRQPHAEPPSQTAPPSR
ncbi:PucR family transcriptional regulator ligand-binding domain-containing protein [Rhodococcus qingshengii]|uniref:PucR family transcriptional regulator ligand-binding domain-containing protein n=1 Tax=Rhodococcus qingshengii TaxID=334542 RepID=UPI0039C404E2